MAHSLWAISSVAGSVKFVFKALGWLFAEDGDKAADCGFNVNGLGVQLGVEHIHLRKVFSSGRKSDLLQLLDAVISSRKLKCLDALKLRGKLRFAAGRSEALECDDQTCIYNVWT